MTLDPVQFRRELHKLPELGFSEFKTSCLLKETIAPIGEVKPLGETGFYVDLGSADASKTLLLRADMDGLPIQEETGLPYASIHPGHMHACGHDAHMAALMGVAFRLHASVPANLRVRLLFQPAEEGRGGARFCVEQGALDGVDAAFGLHLWNELPVGEVALPDGGVMASVVEFEVKFVGRGGHGALPERAKNPIYVAAAFAQSLGDYASSLTGRGALSVGAFSAGDAFNVIPETAEVKGTARAFDEQTETEMEHMARKLGRALAEEHQVDVAFEWKRHHSVTANEPLFSSLARDAARSVADLHTVRENYRTMAGEDFGEILAEVKGAYALVGSGKKDGSSFPHHSPYFDVEEQAIPIAVELHCAVVREFSESI